VAVQLLGTSSARCWEDSGGLVARFFLFGFLWVPFGCFVLLGFLVTWLLGFEYHWWLVGPDG
jgi:hypothetical protein